MTTPAGAAGGTTAPAAIAPGPPGGKPPVFGCPPGNCVGVWDLIDQDGSSIPSPGGWKLEVDSAQEALLKQVRTNAIKAVAVGAWELLEQDGAVQKELAESGNLAAMKQVRARALKAAAERQASRPGTQTGQRPDSHTGQRSVLRSAASAPMGSGPARSPIISEVTPLNGGFEKLPPPDAFPQLPGACPSSPKGPSKA